jgi:hypothetical protein
MQLFQVKALAAIGERSAYDRAAANLYGMHRACFVLGG